MRGCLLICLERHFCLFYPLFMNTAAQFKKAISDPVFIYHQNFVDSYGSYGKGIAAFLWDSAR